MCCEIAFEAARESLSAWEMLLLVYDVQVLWRTGEKGRKNIVKAVQGSCGFTKRSSGVVLYYVKQGKRLSSSCLCALVGLGVKRGKDYEKVDWLLFFSRFCGKVKL